MLTWTVRILFTFFITFPPHRAPLRHFPDDSPATTKCGLPTTLHSFNLACLTYFALGSAFLLPWNAFITAVDYFTYLYPSVNIDRIFAIAYMLFGLARMDCIGDALVQSGIVGNAGELPEQCMQAPFACTAASGVLVSLLRVFTKAVYTQAAEGLRSSANLYFVVSILVMIVCIVFYNVAHRFPIIKYYQDLEVQAVSEEKEDKASLSESAGEVSYGKLLEE